MKYIHIIFFLLAINGVNAMEAERKSLASFFNVEHIAQHHHEDIAINLVHHCLSGKPWWYVDKEIQFCSKKKQLSIERYPNYIRSVCFDNTGAKIIAFPPYADCVACIWNRDGKELERLDDNALYAFCDNNDSWASALYNSGNSPWQHEYEKDMKEWLDERFNLAAMICWDEGQAFVAPQFKACGCLRVHAWDQKEDKILFTIDHQGLINSVHFNQQGIEMITASSDKTMRLWNKKNGKELLRIKYDNKRVTSASFNSTGKEMVVATDDGKIQIFAQYHTDNLQQIFLKKILHLWLQLEKPSKEVDSPEKLLNNVAQPLQLDAQELHAVWKLFQEHMRDVIWLSMYKKIQRYGK